MYTMYMALHITNPETERSVRAMAAATGESIAEAVHKAAIERMRLLTKRRRNPRRMEAVRALLREVDSLPRLDGRTPDQIIGYDENGLPT